MAKEVYYAPIVIEDEEQFDMLGIEKTACEYKRMGARKVLVYQVPAPREVSDYLIKTYMTEYRKEYRSMRCLVPGKLKPLIRCPEKNKCSTCPYAKQPNIISLDEDIEATEQFESRTEDYEEIEDIMNLLYRKNPIFPVIVEKLADGWKPDRIAKYLGIGKSLLSYYRNVIKKIGKEYRENCNRGTK